MKHDIKHYCNVLVIGSGIVGLFTAMNAAESGLDVIIVTNFTRRKDRVRICLGSELLEEKSPVLQGFNGEDDRGESCEESE